MSEDNGQHAAEPEEGDDAEPDDELERGRPSHRFSGPRSANRPRHPYVIGGDKPDKRHRDMRGGSGP